jgi:transcriptional accessory protein Tex/SPT6
MKKGKYIDIYVIMACLSYKKTTTNLAGIDELLDKVCINLDKCEIKTESREPELAS